jgi:hypothetical protein
MMLVVESLMMLFVESLMMLFVKSLMMLRVAREGGRGKRKAECGVGRQDAYIMTLRSDFDTEYGTSTYNSDWDKFNK